MKSLRLNHLLETGKLTPNGVPDLDSWKLFLSNLDTLLAQGDQELSRLQQHILASANAVTLGELLGGISHEINNPLAVIQLRCDQLLEMIAVSDLQPEFFTKSLGSVNTATKKIGEIIAAVRSILKQDTQEPPTFCSLNTITEQAVSLHKHKFSRSGILLELDQAEDIVVEFVAPELSHILFYLLDNAFDAVSSVTNKWVRIQLSKNESEFFMTITDSGSGIAPAICEKIIDSFFTTKTTPENTGIGLFLVSRILAKYHGSIQLVTASLNTQFKITCPLTQAKNGVTATQAS